MLTVAYFIITAHTLPMHFSTTWSIIYCALCSPSFLRHCYRKITYIVFSTSAFISGPGIHPIRRHRHGRHHRHHHHVKPHAVTPSPPERQGNISVMVFNCVVESLSPSPQFFITIGQWRTYKEIASIQ